MRRSAAIPLLQAGPAVCVAAGAAIPLLLLFTASRGVRMCGRAGRDGGVPLWHVPPPQLKNKDGVADKPAKGASGPGGAPSKKSKRLQARRPGVHDHIVVRPLFRLP